MGPLSNSGPHPSPPPEYREREKWGDSNRVTQLFSLPLRGDFDKTQTDDMIRHNFITNDS